MSLLGEHVLLRLYLQTADRAPRQPTWQRAVKAARQSGMAGCTVLEGIAGFSPAGTLEGSPWALVRHLPAIIEIVDTAEKIETYVCGPLEQLLAETSEPCLCTLERANVMMYRQRQHDRPVALQLAALLERPLSTIPRFQGHIQPGGTTMTINENGILLRIFVGESDRIDGRPLHEAILREARQLGLAGATVLRGTSGFGANSVVHKARLLEMSSDLPIIIEIVDGEEKVRALLPYLQRVVQEGLVTMEYVGIILYRHDPADAPASPGPPPPTTPTA